MELALGDNDQINIVKIINALELSVKNPNLKNIVKDICDQCYDTYTNKIDISNIDAEERKVIETFRFKCNVNSLMEAVINGNLKKIKNLYNKGVDIHIHNERALRYAASIGNLEIVKYICRKNADIHAKKDQALQRAANERHSKIVKYLCSHGADCNLAIEEAVGNGYINIVKILCECGANMSSDLLESAILYGHLDIVMYLCENGVDMYNNNDLLRYAIESKNLNIVNYFCEKGIDINVNRNYAIELASIKGYFDIVKCLCEHGATVTKYAIHNAANKGRMEILKQLLKYSKDISFTKKEIQKYDPKIQIELKKIKK